ncbi:hypothetical protein NP493_124g01000 [Ridgeia piscesae]|uniref:Uncharacterized protein n=1 Tax=Ridgeia piscesae TaxID=27915 RepID=A0AAD9UGK9_RIDPI|nr:hypothetical protein NP493_124g01000 [Ridgeia piscesae]
MLRPSRRIGTTELHAGAIYFDIVRFTDCHRAIYIYIMSTCEKITLKKSHVYLELSANMLLYLFAKGTACTPEKKSPRPTFRSEC